MPYTLYKIHHAKGLAYIGRTKQKLGDRLRGHFFKKPMHRFLDIESVTLIEYAELPTEADMFLYEIYLINAEKPMYNFDDKARDGLTVSLPPLGFKQWTSPLMDKWKTEIARKDFALQQKLKAELASFERKQELKSQRRKGEITDDEYYDRINQLI